MWENTQAPRDHINIKDLVLVMIKTGYDWFVADQFCIIGNV